MSRRGPALAAFAAILGFTGAAQDVLAGDLTAHEAIVRRYVSGDRQAALTDLLDLPEPTLPAASQVRRSRPAALLLYTDAFLARRTMGRAPDAYEAMAWGIAVHLRDEETAGHVFARRWCETMAERALIEWGPLDGSLLEAADWVKKGTKAFGASPRLHLVSAAISERLASRVRQPLSRNRPRGMGMDNRARLVRDADARDDLEKAVTSARAAIALDPASADAWLRLGRSSWRLGRAEDARRAFETVLTKPASPVTAHLAHLFLGGLDEEAGSFDAAMASYQAAIALAPDSQTARLALSHLRHRQGDGAGARQEVKTMLDAVPLRTAEDPFWAYLVLPALGVEERLERLRHEAAQP